MSVVSLKIRPRQTPSSPAVLLVGKLWCIRLLLSTNYTLTINRCPVGGYVNITAIQCFRGRIYSRFDVAGSRFPEFMKIEDFEHRTQIPSTNGTANLRNYSAHSRKIEDWVWRKYDKNREHLTLTTMNCGMILPSLWSFYRKAAFVSPSHKMHLLRRTLLQSELLKCVH